MKGSKFESGFLTTPLMRISHPSLAQPSKMEGSPGEPKFGSTFLFEPATFTDADKQRWQKIVAAVKDHFKADLPEAFDDEGRILPNFHNPIRRGEEKPNKTGYGKGVVFFAARNSVRPELGDARKNKLGPEKFYAGCYARANISTWSFKNPKLQGVAFNLHGLIFIGDGEPFGSTNPALESQFGDLSAEEMSFGDPAATDASADPFNF